MTASIERLAENVWRPYCTHIDLRAGKCHARATHLGISTVVGRVRRDTHEHRLLLCEGHAREFAIRHNVRMPREVSER